MNFINTQKSRDYKMDYHEKKKKKWFNSVVVRIRVYNRQTEYYTAAEHIGSILVSNFLKRSI